MFDAESTSSAISRVVRILQAARAPRTRGPKAIYGIRPFPKRGGLVTNDLIDKLREDDAY